LSKSENIAYLTAVWIVDTYIVSGGT